MCVNVLWYVCGAWCLLTYGGGVGDSMFFSVDESGYVCVFPHFTESLVNVQGNKSNLDGCIPLSVSACVHPHPYLTHYHTCTLSDNNH